MITDKAIQTVLAHVWTAWMKLNSTLLTDHESIRIHSRKNRSKIVPFPKKIGTV